MDKMEGRGADTGDREGELEPTSPRSPLAPYPSHPAEWKSRAAEYYGFVAWISTHALFVLYLLWALLPDTLIVRLGIEWYPSRWVLPSLVQPTVLVPTPFFFFLLSTRFLSAYSLALFTLLSLRLPAIQNQKKSRSDERSNYREWSILLPAYSVVLILLTYFIYWALALFNTPPPTDLRTIVGESFLPFP